MPVSRCEFCFAPLEVQYDYDRIGKLLTRRRISKGPRSLWRLDEFLPVGKGETADLGGGWTPLLHAQRLGRELGLRNLYLKNEGVNPTGSVKDRPVSVAVARALEYGFDTVAAASAGNLGISLAAHAAHAGLRCFIFVPEGIDPARLAAIGVYSPRIVTVKGSPDETNRLCSEIMAQYPWAFVNANLRSYYAEGLKTVAQEIAEQLDWSLPDRVIVPMASGALLTRMDRGFRELKHVKLIRDSGVAMHGVQPAGCAPIATAFHSRTDIVRPMKPETSIRALAVGNPADGNYALHTIIETGGTAEKVTDQEAVDAMMLLARTEGVLADAASGAAVAALVKMVAERRVKPSETIVVVLTAAGERDLPAAADRIKPPAPITPNISVFESLSGVKRDKG